MSDEMTNVELINCYEKTNNEELLEEMTQRNLHSVRRLCEGGDFDKARDWLKRN